MRHERDLDAVPQSFASPRGRRFNLIAVLTGASIKPYHIYENLKKRNKIAHMTVADIANQYRLLVYLQAIEMTV